MAPGISFHLGEEADHEDTIDVELPTGWIDADTVTEDDIEDLEEGLTLVADMYEDTGYELEGLRIVDTGDTNKYKGRDDGRPVIEITDRHSLPGTAAHEIGHDVEKYHLGRPFREDAYNKLVSKTFSEVFAHLNALHVTEQLGEDYDDNFTWSLDRSKYDTSWENLEAATDPSNRNEEQVLLDTVVLEEDIDAIEDYTEELLDIPPVTVDEETYGFTIDRDQDMFVFNLPMDSIDRKKQNLNALASMLVETEGRGEDRATRHVRYAHKHHQDGEHPVYEIIVTATDDYLANHDIFEGYEQHLDERQLDREERQEALQDARDQIITAEGNEILEYSFDMTLEQLSNQVAAYRRTLEDDDPVDIAYDAISHEEYGYKRDGDETEHDSYVDFPHNVGGILALELHGDGIGPTDLLDDPDQYLQRCEQAIKDGIADRLG